MNNIMMNMSIPLSLYCQRVVPILTSSPPFEVRGEILAAS